jgi:histidinol dehydrogenase
LANEAAAEHLVVDDDRMAAKVRCAGSLFVGRGRPRLLATMRSVEPRAANRRRRRVRGGLSAADFVRQITVNG